MLCWHSSESTLAASAGVTLVASSAPTPKWKSAQYCAVSVGPVLGQLTFFA